MNQKEKRKKKKNNARSIYYKISTNMFYIFPPDLTPLALPSKNKAFP
jgi:hypothetical protein